ncbi:MAG: NAD(P)-dependent glycerol-3-phosphate dehydrogenase [Simkaniaceae bacterium]|nr:NAD(P)-dependent glycerol-3-phosphate dehydrogenase [Simkaniaceae bacterium]
MKIGYLGSGAWAFALANLLAHNGHDVVMWSIETDVIQGLRDLREHPKFPGIHVEQKLQFTTELKDAVQGMDIIIESVTAKGLRPVLEQILEIQPMSVPFVMTSKGIEQGTGHLLPEIALEVLGQEYRNKIGILSGPSLADEVLHKIPTSVVAASYDPEIRNTISEIFSSSYFRVYPNSDLLGVAFGGAMKNIVAIASGISDGLGFGQNSKAAMITRGLHEMRKLAPYKGAKPETLNGLSGLGDLCVTSLSDKSRNYRFGNLIASGIDVEKAKQKIGMVVEGSYTVVSAMELSKKAGIPLPITSAVYDIIYKHLDPHEAVKALFSREIKDENL